MAKKWRDVINRHGGDVTLFHIPEIGIKDNTHFPMSDLNKVEVADLMSKWLKEKGLIKGRRWKTGDGRTNESAILC
jgi:hypothetical protein